MKQLRLFGAETQLERLSKLGDPLEKAKELIDWEMFRGLPPGRRPRVGGTSTPMFTRR
jgi:hypothetical protein